MDAHLWHAQARFRPAAPEPMSRRELQGSDDRRMESRVRDIQAWVSHLHVRSEATDRVVRTMTDLVEYNERTPAGAKTMIGLTAPNTAGKSTLTREWALNRYRSRMTLKQLRREELPVWRPTRNIEADHVPVVWMNLQAGAARKEFNAQLLHFLGHRSEGYLRATNELVATTIQRQGVRLIVVDDIHLLRTQHRDGQTVLDHLKYIGTALGEHHGTLVFVGADLPGGDIARDPQIAGRMRLLEVPTFRVDTADQRRTWQRLLRDAEDQLAPYLPHSDPGFLAERQAGLLWRRTQGYLGDLGTLLRHAAHEAVASRRWTIDPDMVAGIPLSMRARDEEAKIAARADRGRAR